MYTSDDVLEMMDTLPVGERLFVVEETLRKIRTADPALKKVASPLKTIDDNNTEKVVTPYKHPFLSMAGTWSDAEADEFNKILREGDQIDYDEW